MNNFADYLENNKEVGYIEKLSHSSATVAGLPDVKFGEMVIFESGQLGQVSALKRDDIEVLVLTKDPLRVGMKAARMKRKLMVPIGEGLLGKTIDPLCKTIMGGVADMSRTEMRSIDVLPIGISTRQRINKPMYTGVALVDMMIPLGKGQRELIIGDRKTGKSHLLIQAAVTQVRNGSICVYAGIAKKKSEIKRIESFLKQNDVLKNSVIVASSSQDSAGEIYICPYTAMAVAEYFRDQGRDVLLVLDDMTTHAVFYRELSLVAGKFPGRDSYPGDIFYVHSKLLERGGNFNIGGQEVSITCLPIADTAQGDITGYIQTNLMSMTDGHIYFDAELFSKGRRPAINPFVSVTRVGHQTRTPLAREAGRILTDLLSSYERTQGFLRFGAELGESSRQILTMGERVLTFFNQPADRSIPFNLQLVLLALLVSGIWDGKNIIKILKEYETNTGLVKLVDETVVSCPSMNKLIEKTRQSEDKIMPFLT